MTEPEPRVRDGGHVGQIDATKVPRYGGAATFARLPRIDEVAGADAAVIGIPFDSGVTYRPGARFGPTHIRESSRLLRPYNPALGVSPFATLQVVDAGDLAVSPFSIDEAIATIERGARGLLEQVPYLLALGGDHTIALPLLRAAAAAHGLIGADIVEVAPSYDYAQITGIAAAHVGYELLSALAAGSGGGSSPRA